MQKIDLRKTLKRINIPTLVIHGEDDKIIPVEAGEYLAQNISCAKMVKMAETGHIPHITRIENVKNLITEHCSQPSL